MIVYNILFISHERKMGGANHSLVELVKGLQNLGNNVSVVVLYRGSPIDKKLRELGIQTFPCFFGWWQQPKDWPYIFKKLFRLLHWFQGISVVRLSRYIKKNCVDIIHSNSSVIDIGAQVAARTGCKHVWHFREYGEADYRLEYMYGKDTSMSYVYKNSDAIIYISRALYESYKRFSDDKKSQIIYDGIVSDKMEKSEGDIAIRKKRESQHVFTFLVTGNISPGKNQELVVKAVNILINKMGIDSHRFQVYFAGATTSLAESKKYMRKIHSYINQNIMSNLFFVGYVTDMVSLRSKVDAEIIPSQSEAYGRVTLEAMLSRNLVIASDSGSNPELIGKNEHGLLFKNNDINDLAMKMLQAMDGDNMEYKERAYEYVRKVHRQEESYCKVQSIYDQLMRTHPESEGLI